jgi:ABC-type nickel/cobalt efflux system permease component RcnA
MPIGTDRGWRVRVLSRLLGGRRVWLLGVLALGGAQPCLAHPMGNFSINHYSGIEVDKNSVEVRYIIDRAEIPTYQEMLDAGIAAQVGSPTLPPYLARQAAHWNQGLQLEIDGQLIQLKPVSESVIFPPGAGGLPTMKIGVVFRGAIPSARPRQAAGEKRHLRLLYIDANFPGHAGWKEIVVTVGPDVTLDGSQPFKIDRSAQLTNYPTDLLNSPPQDLEAAFECTLAPLATGVAAASTPALDKLPAKAALPARTSSANPLAPSQAAEASPAAPLLLAPNRQATPRNRFTELMTEPHMGFWFLLTAAFLAAGLGALHALEPGHGKTIVAAYLVGSRGRTRHAVGLGLLVTAAHTAGVYLLGAVVLYASKYVIPERIYPWLSIFSGLVIAVLAAYLLLRAWTGVEAPQDRDSTALHSHWYSMRREPAATAVASGPQDGPGVPRERTVPLRQLLLLGITGGIIPCPAALVVLLSAVSLHRVGLGLFLIVAFSLGLAAVLIALGIIMVRARSLLSRWRSDSPWVQRRLPLASASAMLIAGLAIAASALPATGLSFHLAGLAGGHLASFAAIVGLGLFLGMRHSTDPDHVVAVSTIVTRERSIRQGAVIGMMWGLGHTLTIFMVGAAIILFNLTIPPRLGLSMEMAVAGMLVLLGVLNLTGVLRRMTERFTPASTRSSALAAPPAPDDTSPHLAKRLLNRFGYYHLLRPLAIGLVHGLAGSAAVALLVLSMIHSPSWAIAYLVVFGLGTVIGMMLMTTVMAVPIALTGRSVSRYLTTASGLLSVGFGLFLVYHLGFVDGLFTSHVHWTPE